ncbi:hypothetical protein ACFWFI_33000 [Streptomyces sp. NPDC060209]|uniref:hypothetical protein n=1 Tax=Streptomyces sp. NPDC060209 TaxID=3347073 RepID=UPI00365789A3
MKRKDSRDLGHSWLLVSSLGLGTMNFGSEASGGEVFASIRLGSLQARQEERSINASAARSCWGSRRAMQSGLTRHHEAPTAQRPGGGFVVMPSSAPAEAGYT